MSACPILTKYGMTATIFVLAGFIGKLNTWDVRLRLKQSRHLTSKQIQTLFGRGFGISSHGMQHRFLTRCNEANTRVELWESKAILESLLHHPVQSFSYPYGCLNPKVAEQVKSAGYRVAFSLKPTETIVSESIYRYPRIAVYRCDTLSTFQAKLGLRGRHRFKLECMKKQRHKPFCLFEPAPVLTRGRWVNAEMEKQSHARSGMQNQISRSILPFFDYCNSSPSYPPISCLDTRASRSLSWDSACFSCLKN